MKKMVGRISRVIAKDYAKDAHSLKELIIQEQQMKCGEIS